MDQDLRNALLDKLKVESKPTSSETTDLFNQLGQQLMANDVGSRLESAFQQVAKSSGLNQNQENPNFEQSLKTQVMSKDSLTEAFGISIVPTISTLVGSFIPSNLGAIGGLQMGGAIGGVIGGYVLQKIGKSRTLKDIGSGVVKGSIATFMSGFTNTFVGGLTSGFTGGSTGSSIPAGVTV